MAVRINAAGDVLSRDANLPSTTSFTYSGLAIVRSDQGSSAIQPLLIAMNAGNTDGVLFYWDVLGLGFYCETYLGGSVNSSAAAASRPAVDTPFAWYVKCSGSGAGQLAFGWRAAGSSTWVRATLTMSASISAPSAANLGGFLGAYYCDHSKWNVKVWDRALSDSELDVESYYERPMYPASLNLWWPLYNANDTADRSGNGRNATVSGLATEDTPVNLWRPRQRIFLPAAAASGAVTGSAALVFGAGSSALTGAGALAGSAALLFGAGSSVVSGTGALAGAAASIFGAGSSTLLGSGALAGPAALTITPTGTALGAGALAGSSALTLTPTATLDGAGSLSGVAALVFDGTLARAGDVAGASAVTITPTGTLTGAGTLAGSADMVFGGTAVLTGSGELAGASAVLFTTAGDLTGSAAGDVAGASDLTLSAVGTLTASGALAGIVAMEFGGNLAVPVADVEVPAGGGGGRAGKKRKLALYINGQRMLGTQEDFERLVAQSFKSVPEKELPAISVRVEDKRDNFKEAAQKLEEELEQVLRVVHKRAYEAAEEEEILEFL